ncbi:hypothetical protein AKJ16_DCAP09951 [Drosera capensis]
MVFVFNLLSLFASPQVFLFSIHLSVSHLFTTSNPLFSSFSVSHHQILSFLLVRKGKSLPLSVEISCDFCHQQQKRFDFVYFFQASEDRSHLGFLWSSKFLMIDAQGFLAHASLGWHCSCSCMSAPVDCLCDFDLYRRSTLGFLWPWLGQI